MIIEIVATMFAMGLILGFVGAGGSGFIIGYSLRSSVGEKFP